MSAADREAVRAVNAAWFKAFNAHDVDAITALYAEDAVVSAPGMPLARGAAAIKETLGKDIAGVTKAGLSNNIGTNEELAGRPRCAGSSVADGANASAELYVPWTCRPRAA